MKMFFSTILLSLSIVGALSAITINNQDINTLMKPGEMLSFQVIGDNIVLRITNGNLEIGSHQLTGHEEAQKFFDELNNNRDELYQYIAEEDVSVVSGEYVTGDGVYISGGKKVVLQAGTYITMSAAILKSNESVHLVGNTMKLDACFVDAPYLYFETDSPTSFIKLIRFTLNKENKFPSYAQGVINFEGNEVKDLIVIGAQKVEIIFAPRAFEKNEPAESIQ